MLEWWTPGGGTFQVRGSMSLLKKRKASISRVWISKFRVLALFKTEENGHMFRKPLGVQKSG